MEYQIDGPLGNSTTNSLCSTTLFIQPLPRPPLNFSPNSAPFSNTACFLARCSSFKGLILESMGLSSVPLSQGYSRLNEWIMYRLTASAFKFSELINSYDSRCCSTCTKMKTASITLALSSNWLRSLWMMKSRLIYCDLIKSNSNPKSSQSKLAYQMTYA